MKSPVCLLLLLFSSMAVAYQAPGRSEKSHFDGVWDTVLSDQTPQERWVIPFGFPRLYGMDRCMQKRGLKDSRAGLKSMGRSSPTERPRCMLTDWSEQPIMP